MRKLIAGMKISADEKINTDDGDADWMEGWANDQREDEGESREEGHAPRLSIPRARAE